MSEQGKQGRYYRRLSREELEQRSLQQQQRHLLDMQIETAKLEKQAVNRASFRPTPEHIEILTQVADAGGKIGAELLTTNETRKQLVSELEQPGFLETFCEGYIFVGFAITSHGRELLKGTSPPNPPPDQTAIDAKRLADHVGVCSRTIRVALNECNRVEDSSGRAGHQWRYCEAVGILRSVKTGKLKGKVWPDSANELTTRKDSHKIPARK